jgi:diguanylate cyclase (GGDEF)-like protein
LPETAYEPALEVARKLRRGVSQTAFKAGSQNIRVTASFGLCGLDRVPVGVRRVAERMLKIADAALYRSKHAGRNRVTATTILNARSGDTTDRRASDPQDGAVLP